MSENDNNQLVLFNSSDGMISLPVAVKNDSVWLTLDQISELFDRDKSTVSRHIHNVYRENELDTSSTVAKIATVQLEGTRKARFDCKTAETGYVLMICLKIIM